jgi:glycosyltransferase involved in cell wall biosynthesis
MKLSVLLPTRNGGPFLHDCIASILAQPDEELELVVCDNANEDETAEVLARFAHDPRMKVKRLDVAIPVTDNWNAALDASDGDYILMMGDDDYLPADYTRRIRALIAAHDEPDCITYGAHSYVFPSAIDGLPVSHYADPHFSFGPEFSGEMLLSAEMRRRIVADMFRFRNRIPLNMQTTLVARKAIERLPGALFKAPFPDHYALNALLLTAERWLYSPEQLVIVGVSLKSFGHFVYSSQQDAGLAYLGIAIDLPRRLPGNELFNAMYVWLLLLKHDFPRELGDIEVSRADYALRQTWASITAWRLGHLSGRRLVRRIARVSPAEWLGIARLATDREMLGQLAKRVRLRRDDTAQQLWLGLRPLPEVGGIAEFAAWLQERAGAPASRDAGAKSPAPQ